ncbi:hypothetical protein CMV_008878 [Castanea mollissima]|uniref:Uncharacterized protein n=1 Tax=Castanea mollissima TaxID=60419 RepID=A0A8J4RQ70_9ROSI|nr:hypothetical protein CMV_008878 [Castanea mollissima]
MTEKTENLGGTHELSKTIVSDEEVLNNENDSWEDIDGMDEEGEGIVLMQYSWERTDRDYECEEITSGGEASNHSFLEIGWVPSSICSVLTCDKR